MAKTHLTIASIFVLIIPGIASAESSQQAFVKAWQGKNVMVRRELYTLVYNERGLLGTSRTGKRDGLVVATPDQGTYLQFDGRQGRRDIVENNPQRMFDAVSALYEADGLEVRAYRKVEPIRVIRYDPGFEFFVDKVRIEDRSVSLSFALRTGPDASDDVATSLRIKWPVAFSRSFSEHAVVTALIGQFIQIR